MDINKLNQLIVEQILDCSRYMSSTIDAYREYVYLSSKKEKNIKRLQELESSYEEYIYWSDKKYILENKIIGNDENRSN